MKRFEEVLENLSYEDLVLLKKDVDGTGFATKRLLEEKIKKKMKDHEKSCATCLSPMRFYSTSNYTIVFGPDDFKKKASFCGLDCLEYFITELKRLKGGSQRESAKKMVPIAKQGLESKEEL